MFGQCLYNRIHVGFFFFFNRIPDSQKIGYAQIIGYDLIIFTITPLQNNRSVPWWPQWSYYLLHLSLPSSETISSKSDGPAKFSKSLRRLVPLSLVTKNIILSIDKAISMTAVIILVIPLIIFNIGWLILLVLKRRCKKAGFCTLHNLWVNYKNKLLCQYQEY